MKSKYIIIAIFLLPASYTHAQKTIYEFWNADMKEITEPISERNWLKVKETSNLKLGNFFESNNKALGLTDVDEMRLLKTSIDRKGITHHKYQQFHNGIKVEGAEYIIHSKDDKIRIANGYLAPKINLTTSASISLEEATNAALSSIKSSNNISMHRKVFNAELIFRNANTYKDDAQLHPELSFKIDIRVDENILENRIIYVHAHTGEITKSYSPIKNCDHQGNANTIYHGNRNIITEKKGSNYFLFDCTRNIESRNSIYSEVDHGTNTWGTSHRNETTALWAVSKAWDYFNYVQYWGGHDGNYQKRLYLKTDTGARAAYGGNSNGHDIISHGVGKGSKGPYATIDVMAHEFTHGVVEYTANFSDHGESPSINEGFADIFGAMVENYILAGSQVYIIGDQIITNGLRKISDPNNSPDPQPDTYLGNYWKDVVNCNPSTNNESCYRHINSGVLSYWFYLLAEGGNGVNDNGLSYNITGIGKTDATLIAFNALKSYLTSTTQYSDVKNATIWTAFEWFGPCSPEVEQTIKAWDAVGVPLGNWRRDHIVDCSRLNVIHDAGDVFRDKGFKTIEINCPISPNPALVDISAGEKVTLKTGFKSGPNFYAHIDQCFENIQLREKDLTSSSLAIESNRINIEKKPHEVKVVPNPNNGIFYLSLSAEKVYDIAIYNTLGKIVSNNKVINQEKHFIDLSANSNGIYIVKIYDGTSIKTSKVVKQEF